MRVMLIFDPNYGSNEAADLGDAFWLVRSPDNSKLAERAWEKSDPNSALFEPSGLPPTIDDFEARLHDVDLHHPDWIEVRVIGFELTPMLCQQLERLGVKASAGQGRAGQAKFTVTR